MKQPEKIQAVSIQDQDVVLKAGCDHLVVPASPSSRTEMMWHMPPEMGSGLFRTLFFDSGMSVTLSRCRLERPLHARLHDRSDTFMLVFPLEGHSVNKNRCMKQGFEMAGGQNCLYRFPDEKMVREGEAGQTLVSVVISIPETRLSPEDLDLPDTRSRTAEFIFEKDHTSPAMNMILGQMMQCRFTGRARQFFLEGKALALLALKLEMLKTSPPPSPDVSNEHKAAVFAARDLLLSDITSPPSIHDLARASGMSHPKLLKLFKSVFGCSPFELLRTKRLEWARELVEGNEMSLTEIAYAMGYSGSSHFSKAFFSHYGIQPSRLRKNTVNKSVYSMPEKIRLSP